jgi:predicted DNA repair protein MutK
MAGGSFLLLLDDIAAVLDDVAILSKVAAKKTAGVLGDDLALNAQQVAGVKADRELPVVWAVAKGSFINKLILVPAALAISAFAPWAMTPLLMIGGAFLCFEGFEKIIHPLLHKKSEDEAHHQEHVQALTMSDEDLIKLEKDKIKGAIRTDFILSAEIIVIAMAAIGTVSMATRIGVLSTVAIGMTIGVYGLVAGIVKLDDWGLALTQKANSAAQAFGRGLLAFAPLLMKFLSIAGTAAMFLVGGGILVHGIAPLHHMQQGIEKSAGLWGSVPFDGAVGLAAGATIVAVVLLGKKLFTSQK